MQKHNNVADAASGLWPVRDTLYFNSNPVTLLPIYFNISTPLLSLKSSFGYRKAKNHHAIVVAKYVLWKHLTVFFDMFITGKVLKSQ